MSASGAASSHCYYLTRCIRKTSCSQPPDDGAVLHRQRTHIAMSISVSAATSIAQPKAAYKVLGALSASHMINDMMQSLILAMYPILKGGFNLSFTQIGL